MSYTSKSKTLNAACKKHPHVSECYSDQDGYWIYTTEGYIQEEMECGTIHEQTVKECLEYMRGIVKGDFVDGHSVPRLAKLEAA